MPEESLMTDEVRSLIGLATELRPVTITEEAVRRAYAAYEGDAPEVFAAGQLVPGFVLMSLQPDGDSLRVPDILPTSLLVSNEFMIERPLRLGEQLQARSRIADISERLGGQFGHALYVRTEVELLGPDHDLVGRSASTLMYYDPAGAKSRDGER